jgi:hypothetical protein
VIVAKPKKSAAKTKKVSLAGRVRALEKQADLFDNLINAQAEVLRSVVADVLRQFYPGFSAGKRQ